jgi:hypothetical protein
MLERDYDFHGVRLRVAAPEALHARLTGLPRDPRHSGDDGLFFEVVAGSGQHLFGRPEGARLVYEPPEGEVAYKDGDDLLYLEIGPRLRVLCELGRGRARVSVLGGEEGDLWTLSHPLFTMPLAELLKRRGLYSLHAGGLCLGGRALVLPGTSGAGKSTLSLALARAGFGFQGDDTLFLAQRPQGVQGVRVLAFPDEVDLTDETVRFFPELGRLLEVSHPSGWRKRQLRAEEVYGAEIIWECAPGLLVFPRVSGRLESALTPISPDEALLELAPNVLLTDFASSQAHLDALAGLAAMSDCCRLETGTDLDAAVRLLRKALERP